MIRVDDFLDRVKSNDYRCFDYVREVWAACMGEDIGDQLETLAATVSGRKLVASELKQVTKIDTPVDPCVVVFQRKRTRPHMGILWHGRVLHLASTGAQYARFDSVARRYTKVSYYR